MCVPHALRRFGVFRHQLMIQRADTERIWIGHCWLVPLPLPMFRNRLRLFGDRLWRTSMQQNGQKQSESNFCYWINVRRTAKSSLVKLFIPLGERVCFASNFLFLFYFNFCSCIFGTWVIFDKIKCTQTSYIAQDASLVYGKVVRKSNKFCEGVWCVPHSHIYWAKCNPAETWQSALGMRRPELRTKQKNS